MSVQASLTATPYTAGPSTDVQVVKANDESHANDDVNSFHDDSMATLSDHVPHETAKPSNMENFASSVQIEEIKVEQPG